MRSACLLCLPLSFLLAAGRCGEESLTSREAKDAVDEIALSSQALTLTSGTIEISTNFTIGQAVEEAAEELKEFIAAQLPCAAIEIADATLSIEYGATEGLCLYNGQSYSGNHTITITSANAGELIVDHVWDGLTNGVLSVSGNAKVTWSSAESSRHVVHDLTWTRLRDGKEGVGRGDRTQTVLELGLSEGIEVNGSRSWTSDLGEWELDIDAVQIRWVDPVPQSGSYQLDTPFDKSLEMAFRRVDDDTIRVTVTSGRRTFNFNINKLGSISD